MSCSGGRRSSGWIFPIRASVVRLVGIILAEDDERQHGRR
jgi:hypothetical protein